VSISLLEAIVVVGAGLLSIIEGIRVTTVPKMLTDPLGPGLYNVGLGSILAILGLISLTSRLRKVTPRAKKGGREKAREKEYTKHEMTMISIILVIVIYIFLIYLIGYLFGSVIFFILLNRIVGYRRWLTNLASATIMTASYYLIFVKWMGMIFPSPVLFNF
jgi:hypothetical protein